MSFVKKILLYFKNPHFLSLIGTGFNSFIGLATFGLLYRALSQKEIGIYLIFTVVLNLIDTVKAGLLTGAFITFFSGSEPARAKNVSGSTWGLALLITGALMVINLFTYLCSGYVADRSIALIFTFFSIVSLSTLPSFMGNLAVQGERRFDRLLWVNLTTQVLFMATVIILMALKKSSLMNVVYTLIATNALASLIILSLGWTKIENLKHATRKTILEIFHFGKYSFGTSLSANLFRVTDNFFLSYYLGPAAVAIYNLGVKLNQVVEIPLLSLATSGAPVLASHYNHDEDYSVIYVMRKMIGMLTIPFILLAFVSVIFANPIIAIIGGGQYISTQAPLIFSASMFISILAPSDRFMGLTLDIIHKPQINFYKILIMLAINLVTDYAGVKLFHSPLAISVNYIFAIAAAVAISYFPLNKYYKYNFWSSYSIGYKEIILFLKKIFSKKASAID